MQILGLLNLDAAVLFVIECLTLFRLTIDPGHTVAMQRFGALLQLTKIAIAYKTYLSD